ncbi:hypothetical protein HMPREF9141_2193 [Prevotella multiformis DSM 16608]|uniref:Uncharacterized protein n=1 Tax=Prevotella multiformis DSM 16608 TaxID=888743 RepID=F0F9C6_9BACT|nr:hypothetical protein HMPREF9141_2193 [Prevotella multiformis DSM 16608]
MEDCSDTSGENPDTKKQEKKNEGKSPFILFFPPKNLQVSNNRPTFAV